jgi:Glyoxalase/Bleomycin resistance protein/Dioxygenase superfamily
MLLNYGQPLDGIMQFSYFVRDIRESIRQFVSVYKAGPWFLAASISPPDCYYRGKRTRLNVSVALAFSGSIMIELIQQHDNEPSVYLEALDRVGYGFHHFAVVTNDYDLQVERYRAAGYEFAFNTIIQGGRVCYLDTTNDLPGMTELIEWTVAAEARQTRIQRASQEWDGSDPIRPLRLL